METIEVGEIIVMIDEDDEEQEVEVIGKMTVDGNDYIAVVLVEDTDEETEEDLDVFFLRVNPENGDLFGIESDEEFEKVSAAFSEAINENEDD